MENEKKQKILRFRSLMPIPISEVKTYLAKRNWEVEKAVEDFKQEKIKEIATLTGENTQLVEEIFLEHKFDFNKTVSYFRRKKEDANFDTERLKEISEQSFELINEWQKWENQEGLIAALGMKNIQQYITILRYNLKMEKLAQKTENALHFLSSINLNELSLEEYSKLFFTEEFQALEKQIDKDKIKFEEQLALVKRNFDKKGK